MLSLEPGIVKRLLLLPGAPVPLLPPLVLVRLPLIRLEVQPVVIIAASKIPRAGGAIGQTLVNPLRHAAALAAAAQASGSLRRHGQAPHQHTSGWKEVGVSRPSPLDLEHWGHPKDPTSLRTLGP